MIVSKNTTKSYPWGDNCLAWEIFKDENLSIKEEVMPPNTEEQKDLHHISKQYFYILQGKAIFFLNHQLFDLKEGDGIHVPPQSFHQIKNTNSEDLKFLVISQPPIYNDKTYFNNEK